nr:hypothetical protein [Tanacetum cinerariifolium]
NEEREKSFEELKQRLVSAPVLTLPSGSGGFQTYSDASKKGLGCVLMQYGKVITYASRQPKPYEADFRFIVMLLKRVLVVYSCNMERPQEPQVYFYAAKAEHETKALVKIEHQRASGLLQQLDIPVWKWDEISMDFVTGLPQTQRRHNAIWVVVDRLTKSAHFLPIRKDYPVSRLKFSTAFHPQTDGQSERTIQTLEDMLHSCALEWTGNWDDYICLDQVRERVIEGPEMIEVTNAKVVVAKEKLKEARTCQKVSPTRGVRRFGIKGKLSPRFIEPFEILDRVGEVSYRLVLPPQLSHVQDVFHVSLLRGVMRKKTIPFVKILWRNHPEREATWKTEESIRTSYPHFLP